MSRDRGKLAAAATTTTTTPSTSSSRSIELGEMPPSLTIKQMISEWDLFLTHAHDRYLLTDREEKKETKREGPTVSTPHSTGKLWFEERQYGSYRPEDINTHIKTVGTSSNIAEHITTADPLALGRYLGLGLVTGKGFDRYVSYDQTGKTPIERNPYATIPMPQRYRNCPEGFTGRYVYNEWMDAVQQNENLTPTEKTELAGRLMLGMYLCECENRGRSSPHVFMNPTGLDPFSDPSHALRLVSAIAQYLSSPTNTYNPNTINLLLSQLTQLSEAHRDNKNIENQCMALRALCYAKQSKQDAFLQELQKLKWDKGSGLSPQVEEAIIRQNIELLRLQREEYRKYQDWWEMRSQILPPLLDDNNEAAFKNRTNMLKIELDMVRLELALLDSLSKVNSGKDTRVGALLITYLPGVNADAAIAGKKKVALEQLKEKIERRITIDAERNRHLYAFYAGLNEFDQYVIQRGKKKPSFFGLKNSTTDYKARKTILDELKDDKKNPRAQDKLRIIEEAFNNNETLQTAKVPLLKMQAALRRIIELESHPDLEAEHKIPFEAPSSSSVSSSSSSSSSSAATTSSLRKRS